MRRRWSKFSHVSGDLELAAGPELLQEGVDVDGGGLGLLLDDGPEGRGDLLPPAPARRGLAGGQDGHVHLQDGGQGGGKDGG